GPGRAPRSARFGTHEFPASSPQTPHDRNEAAPDGRVVSASERKAKALVEMARRSAATAPGVPAQPLIMVLADLETLARRAGRGAEIVGAGPVSAETARRLACDAEVARVLTDPEGEILDLGQGNRTPNRAQRRALVARDGGCAITGCDRPHDWCQAHHITHWIDGGPTDLCNLCLLCVRHHHLIHEGGFGLARAPNGELVFTRPDGSVIEPRPWAA
ncbi:MAG: HNH endonuclease, partial [Actinomycetota bacterium]|nr:HNH endonuclease [Actinomycetota bacterium]